MPQIYCRSLMVEADAIDLHRHVNNQEYLRWMQEVAIEHSTAQGWSMERYLASGASWYVRSHLIEYLRPARLGDHLRIATWVAAMDERTSLRRTLFQREDNGQVLAKAETRWTYIRLPGGRPLAIPDEVRAAFELLGDDPESVARDLHAPAGAV